MMQMEQCGKMVSIIIPCYNCAAMVLETLDSLAEQTFQDFEVICINDGSTDGTLDVLTQYAARNLLAIKIFTQENSGVSKTRNRGIVEATGRYILFLDSDDLYHPEFIARMVAPLEKGVADTSYCRLTRDLFQLRALKTDALEYSLQGQNEAMQKLLFEMPSYGFYCYIYRRDVLINNNLRFDERIRYFEDREFNWKYLCHCRKFAWIDIPMYGYRVSENSAMRKKTTWERTTGSLAAVKRVEAYMERENCAFLDTLKSYLYPRVMWGVAKNIAIAKDKMLYTQLRTQYDVRSCMKRTAKDSNKLVALASWLYLVHPMLFYYIVGLKK